VADFSGALKMSKPAPKKTTAPATGSTHATTGGKQTGAKAPAKKK